MTTSVPADPRHVARAGQRPRRTRQETVPAHKLRKYDVIATYAVDAPADRALVIRLRPNLRRPHERIVDLVYASDATWYAGQRRRMSWPNDRPCTRYVPVVA